MLWMLVGWTLAVSGGPAAQLQAALAQEADGDLSGSLVALERLVRAHPTWELPRIELARLLLRAGGELERSGLHLEIAASLSPENPRTHYLRGTLHEERGEPDRALAAYQTALAYRSTYADAHRRLGALLLAKGDAFRAEHHYRLLARAHPEEVQSRLQLAEALEKQGRMADSERELLRLRAEQPRHVLVTRRLAALYERTGRPEEARRVRTALKAPPARKMRPLPRSRR